MSTDAKGNYGIPYLFDGDEAVATIAKIGDRRKV